MNAHNATALAVLAALEAAPALASGNIYRSRKRAIAAGVTRAVVVRFNGSDPARGAILGAPIDWTTDVACEAYARERGDDGEAEAAALELQGEVYARLQADPTLADAVDDVGPPRIGAVDGEQLDEELACIVGIYPVLHRTSAGSLDV